MTGSSASAHLEVQTFLTLGDAMPEWFDTSWDRIARAKAHGQAFAEAWNGLDKNDLYDTTVYVEDDGTGYISLTQIEPFPSDLSLELGEFLYQMRAALDACVYDLACVNTGQDPPPDENRLEFPVCRTANAFKNSTRKIAPLTDKQRSIIEAVQPYNRPPGLTPSELPDSFNRGLNILNDWARIDRHRRLHLMATWASNIQPKIDIPLGVTVEEFTIVREEPFILESEHILARFRLGGYVPESRIQGNPNLSLDVLVNESPLPCHDIDTIDQRLRCIDLTVGTVVQSLGVTVGVDRVK